MRGFRLGCFLRRTLGRDRAENLELGGVPLPLLRVSSTVVQGSTKEDHLEKYVDIHCFDPCTTEWRGRMYLSWGFHVQEWEVHITSALESLRSLISPESSRRGITHGGHPLLWVVTSACPLPTYCVKKRRYGEGRDIDRWSVIGDFGGMR